MAMKPEAVVAIDVYATDLDVEGQRTRLELTIQLIKVQKDFEIGTTLNVTSALQKEKPSFCVSTRTGDASTEQRRSRNPVANLKQMLASPEVSEEEIAKLREVVDFLRGQDKIDVHTYE